MRYAPCWKQIGISRDRYFELLHYCRQYPQWKMEADSMLGIHAIKMDSQPHGTTVGDPVASAAERRDRLIRKMDIVDTCASAVGGGAWEDAIKANVCMAKAYQYIDKALMPTSDSNKFFCMRREFFDLLDKMLQ